MTRFEDWLAESARILGADHDLGTIEEGKWADLLILDADPLEDIRNTRRIWRVIQGGQVVERDAPAREVVGFIDRSPVADRADHAFDGLRPGARGRSISRHTRSVR